jgi:hypothetical protein
MLSRFGLLLLLALAGTSTCAVAQNANNIMGLFSNIMRAAIIDHASSEWRKLPPAEAACLEQA